eukprot:TRINITY_DN2055_c0_g1_i5.p1 TRINITY_DN2055_c0_g1~~TRINITY_DN2055_c0_g1_i5.p1  ORF type:complete len:2894 (-),score=950.41 TRINITY_DN2055_c0_g1_i5:140-8821(-)
MLPQEESANADMDPDASITCICTLPHNEIDEGTVILAGTSDGWLRRWVMGPFLAHALPSVRIQFGSPIGVLLPLVDIVPDFVGFVITDGTGDVRVFSLIHPLEKRPKLRGYFNCGSIPTTVHLFEMDGSVRLNEEAIANPLASSPALALGFKDGSIQLWKVPIGSDRAPNAVVPIKHDILLRGHRAPITNINSPSSSLCPSFGASKSPKWGSMSWFTSISADCSVVLWSRLNGCFVPLRRWQLSYYPESVHFIPETHINQKVENMLTEALRAQLPKVKNALLDYPDDMIVSHISPLETISSPAFPWALVASSKKDLLVLPMNVTNPSVTLADLKKYQTSPLFNYLENDFLDHHWPPFHVGFLRVFPEHLVSGFRRARLLSVSPRRESPRKTSPNKNGSPNSKKEGNQEKKTSVSLIQGPVGSSDPKCLVKLLQDLVKRFVGGRSDGVNLNTAFQKLLSQSGPLVCGVCGLECDNDDFQRTTCCNSLLCMECMATLKNNNNKTRHSGDDAKAEKNEDIPIDSCPICSTNIPVPLPSTTTSTNNSLLMNSLKHLPVMESPTMASLKVVMPAPGGLADMSVGSNYTANLLMTGASSKKAVNAISELTLRQNNNMKGIVPNNNNVPRTTSFSPQKSISQAANITKGRKIQQQQQQKNRRRGGKAGSSRRRRPLSLKTGKLPVSVGRNNNNDFSIQATPAPTRSTLSTTTANLPETRKLASPMTSPIRSEKNDNTNSPLSAQKSNNNARVKHFKVNYQVMNPELNDLQLPPQSGRNALHLAPKNSSRANTALGLARLKLREENNKKDSSRPLSPIVGFGDGSTRRESIPLNEVLHGEHPTVSIQSSVLPSSSSPDTPATSITQQSTITETPLVVGGELKTRTLGLGSPLVQSGMLIDQRNDGNENNLNEADEDQNNNEMDFGNPSGFVDSFELLLQEENIKQHQQRVQGEEGGLQQQSDNIFEGQSLLDCEEESSTNPYGNNGNGIKHARSVMVPTKARRRVSIEFDETTLPSKSVDGWSPYHNNDNFTPIGNSGSNHVPVLIHQPVSINQSQQSSLSQISDIAESNHHHHHQQPTEPTSGEVSQWQSQPTIYQSILTTIPSSLTSGSHHKHNNNNNRSNISYNKRLRRRRRRKKNQQQNLQTGGSVASPTSSGIALNVSIPFGGIPSSDSPPSQLVQQQIMQEQQQLIQEEQQQQQQQRELDDYLNNSDTSFVANLANQQQQQQQQQLNQQQYDEGNMYNEENHHNGNDDDGGELISKYTATLSPQKKHLRVGGDIEDDDVNHNHESPHTPFTDLNDESLFSDGQPSPQRNFLRKNEGYGPSHSTLNRKTMRPLAVNYVAPAIIGKEILFDTTDAPTGTDMIPGIVLDPMGFHERSPRKDLISHQKSINPLLQSRRDSLIDMTLYTGEMVDDNSFAFNEASRLSAQRMEQEELEAEERKKVEIKVRKERLKQWMRPPSREQLGADAWTTEIKLAALDRSVREMAQKMDIEPPKTPRAINEELSPVSILGGLPQKPSTPKAEPAPSEFEMWYESPAAQVHRNCFLLSEMACAVSSREEFVEEWLQTDGIREQLENKDSALMQELLDTAVNNEHVARMANADGVEVPETKEEADEKFVKWFRRRSVVGMVATTVVRVATEARRVQRNISDSYEMTQQHLQSAANKKTIKKVLRSRRRSSGFTVPSAAHGYKAPQKGTRIMGPATHRSKKSIEDSTISSPQKITLSPPPLPPTVKTQKKFLNDGKGSSHTPPGSPPISPTSRPQTQNNPPDDQSQAARPLTGKYSKYSDQASVLSDLEQFVDDAPVTVKDDLPDIPAFTSQFRDWYTSTDNNQQRVAVLKAEVPTVRRKSLLQVRCEGLPLDVDVFPSPQGPVRRGSDAADMLIQRNQMKLQVEKHLLGKAELEVGMPVAWAGMGTDERMLELHASVFDQFVFDAAEKDGVAVPDPVLMRKRLNEKDETVLEPIKNIASDTLLDLGSDDEPSMKGMNLDIDGLQWVGGIENKIIDKVTRRGSCIIPSKHQRAIATNRVATRRSVNTRSSTGSMPSRKKGSANTNQRVWGNFMKWFSSEKGIKVRKQVFEGEVNKAFQNQVLRQQWLEACNQSDQFIPFPEWYQTTAHTRKRFLLSQVAQTAECVHKRVKKDERKVERNREKRERRRLKEEAKEKKLKELKMRHKKGYKRKASIPIIERRGLRDLAKGLKVFATHIHDNELESDSESDSDISSASDMGDLEPDSDASGEEEDEEEKLREAREKENEKRRMARLEAWQRQQAHLRRQELEKQKQLEKELADKEIKLREDEQQNMEEEDELSYQLREYLQALEDEKERLKMLENENKDDDPFHKFAFFEDMPKEVPVVEDVAWQQGSGLDNGDEEYEAEMARLEEERQISQFKAIFFKCAAQTAAHFHLIIEQRIREEAERAAQELQKATENAMFWEICRQRKLELERKLDPDSMTMSQRAAYTGRLMCKRHSERAQMVDEDRAMKQYMADCEQIRVEAEQKRIMEQILRQQELEQSRRYDAQKCAEEQAMMMEEEKLAVAIHRVQAQQNVVQSRLAALSSVAFVPFEPHSKFNDMDSTLLEEWNLERPSTTLNKPPRSKTSLRQKSTKHVNNNRRTKTALKTREDINPDRIKTAMRTTSNKFNMLMGLPRNKVNPLERVAKAEQFNALLGLPSSKPVSRPHTRNFHRPLTHPAHENPESRMIIPNDVVLHNAESLGITQTSGPKWGRVSRPSTTTIPSNKHSGVKYNALNKTRAATAKPLLLDPIRPISQESSKVNLTSSMMASVDSTRSRSSSSSSSDRRNSEDHKITIDIKNTEEDNNNNNNHSPTAAMEQTTAISPIHRSASETVLRRNGTEDQRANTSHNMSMKKFDAVDGLWIHRSANAAKLLERAKSATRLRKVAH